MEVILVYPHNSNVITRTLIRGRQEDERGRGYDNRSRGWSDAVGRWRRRPQAKECGHPLKNGKDKEMGPPLEPLEGTQPC